MIRIFPLWSKQAEAPGRLRLTEVAGAIRPARELAQGMNLGTTLACTEYQCTPFLCSSAHLPPTRPAVLAQMCIPTCKSPGGLLRQSVPWT